MKRILILSLICSIGIFSCQGVQFFRVEKTVSSTKVMTYIINTTETFNSYSTLFPKEIIETLTNEVRNSFGTRDYTIKSLTIQSLSVGVRKNSTNTASSAKISSLVVNAGSASAVPFIQEHDADIDQTSPYLANAFLRAGGTSVVNTALANAIKQTGGVNGLNISIVGNPIPAKTRISIILTLNVKFTLEYAYCEETLSYVINPLEECQL